MEKGRPENVGIVAMDAYIPKNFVSQAELEKFDNVSQGKYTIGLGQINMAFCYDNEDIHSVAMNAVHSLMTKYGINYQDIGRLEVGTETLVDKSKSVKTVLMELFKSSGNSDVEGVDVTNACFGGTQALFNSVAWVESSCWDGRYALVVAADIAVYAAGAARPTGGAGAIAMLIGPNAPITFEGPLRSLHMDNVYDFYKPNLTSEYPTVDGPLSISCFLKALDTTYQGLSAKFKRLTGEDFGIGSFDYAAFHTPFNKLVVKAFGRVLYNEFLKNPDHDLFKDVQGFRDLAPEETYTNRDVEQAFVKLSSGLFAEKVAPSTTMSKQMGNIYTGSVYSALLSILANKGSELVGKRIMVFSYGSGLASALFTLKVRDSVEEIVKKSNVLERLETRVEVQPAQFVKALQGREEIYGRHSFKPMASSDTLLPGTYYLTGVDEKYRRTYDLLSPGKSPSPVTLH